MSAARLAGLVLAHVIVLAVTAGILWLILVAIPLSAGMP